MESQAKRIIRLHLLARPGQQKGLIVRVSADEIETGDWVATQETAEAAIGAELHLHEFQKEVSWRSGIVTGWRWHESGNGRVVYRVRVNDALRKTQQVGWPSRGERLAIWNDG